MAENIEREVKFLEIDKDAVIKRLRELGAEDLGDKLLAEVIFYPGEDIGHQGKRWVRIRNNGNTTKVTYKSIINRTGIEVEEIEFEADDPKQAEHFIVALGWVVARRQEKKRHSFTLGQVQIDIDTWPGNVPTYLEIEGPNEAAIKKTAEDLRFNWSDAVMQTVGILLKERYNINVWKIKKFTFDEIE